MGLGKIIQEWNLHDRYSTEFKNGFNGLFSLGYDSTDGQISWKDAVKAGWTFAKAIALDTKPVLLKAVESQTWGMFRGMMVKNNVAISVEQADSLKGTIDRFSWNYVRLRPHAETYLNGDASWAINIEASSFADLIWNHKWSKRFGGYYEPSGTIVWEQNSANGWMGNYVYDYLQEIMQGMSAQKLIQSFDYSQVLMDAAARTVPFYKYTDNPARDAGPLRELIELGFEMARVGATNPAGIATEPSAWLEAVMEGNAKLAGEGLSQFVAPLEQPNQVWFDGDRYGSACRSAFDYAQRLVQVAGAVDDPVLDAEVLKADVLSELVHLGGAYAALNPRNDGNLSFFLDTANATNTNFLTVSSNELEDFLRTVPIAMTDRVLQLSGKLLLALQDVPAAKPFVNDPAFIDRHLRLARDFVLLNSEPSSAEPAKTSLALLDRAKTIQDVRTVALKMQDNTVKLLSSLSIGGDDDSPIVRNPFIVTDSDSLNLKNVLMSGVTQFDLSDYSVYNVVPYDKTPSQQMVIVNANKSGYFGTLNFNTVYTIGIPSNSYTIPSGEILPYYYILRNGELFYYPEGTTYKLQPGDK